MVKIHQEGSELLFELIMEKACELDAHEEGLKVIEKLLEEMPHPSCDDPCYDDKYDISYFINSLLLTIFMTNFRLPVESDVVFNFIIPQAMKTVDIEHNNITKKYEKLLKIRNY